MLENVIEDTHGLENGVVNLSSPRILTGISKIELIRCQNFGAIVTHDVATWLEHWAEFNRFIHVTMHTDLFWKPWEFFP